MNGRLKGSPSPRKKGVYNRAPKLTAQQIQQAKEQIELGVPKAKIARDLEVSRQTLYDALAGRGRYGDVVQKMERTTGD